MKRFVEETGLPFNVLVDDRRDVVKAYGVWHRLGWDAWDIARPAAFLIDRSGAIRFHFVGASQTDFPTHDEIARAVALL